MISCKFHDIYFHRIIESQNHNKAWVGKDLKEHLIPTPLPWTGKPPTRSDCLGMLKFLFQNENVLGQVDEY